MTRLPLWFLIGVAAFVARLKELGLFERWLQ